MSEGITVAFCPALTKPISGTARIANWRDNRQFALDLRLASTSPGRGKGSDGRDIGSSLDIPAIMRGDVDSDGIRGLPDIPADVYVSDR